MRPSLPSRRSRPVTLTVTAPAEPQARRPRGPQLHWGLAAVLWTVGAALVGWLAVGLVASLGWATATRTPVTAVLSTTGQAWLAVHGAPARFGDAVVHLTPLGISLLVLAACAVAGHQSASQYVLPDRPTERQRWTAFASVVGACLGTYLIVALISAVLAGSGQQLSIALAGALLISLVGSANGALVGLRLDPLAHTPTWVRRLPRSAGMGLGVLALGSLVVAIVALVSHWSQVRAIEESLVMDAGGSVLLWLVQLAWLPTLLLWAGSFMLGAGVTLGPGGLVAPGQASVGVLPAIPVLGALPTAPGEADWAWLAVGVLAGALAGWWMVRRLSTPTGHGWTAGLWQGGLAGLLTGVLWVAASALALGDLGTNRLRGMGPRFPDLLLWGTLPLALAGAVAGAGWLGWLVYRQHRAVSAAAAATLAAEQAEERATAEPTLTDVAPTAQEAEKAQEAE